MRDIGGLRMGLGQAIVLRNAREEVCVQEEYVYGCV